MNFQENGDIPPLLRDLNLDEIFEDEMEQEEQENGDIPPLLRDLNLDEIFEDEIEYIESLSL